MRARMVELFPDAHKVAIPTGVSIFELSTSRCGDAFINQANTPIEIGDDYYTQYLTLYWKNALCITAIGCQKDRPKYAKQYRQEQLDFH